MRVLLFLLLLTAWEHLRALPASFAESLFGASAIGPDPGMVWTLGTGRPPTDSLKVTRCTDGTTETRSDCPPHPNGLAKAWLTRVFDPADADGRQRVRMTYTVQSTSDRPAMGLAFTFFSSDRFPPCSVRPCGNSLALVSDTGDWHIIADRPDAAFTVSSAEPPRITLAYPPKVFRPGEQGSYSITIGDGPLPAPVHE